MALLVERLKSDAMVAGSSLTAGRVTVLCPSCWHFNVYKQDE